MGASAVTPFNDQVALLDQVIDIDSLGGTIKVGEVLYRGPVRAIESLPLDWQGLRSGRSGKLIFGLSYYATKMTVRSVLAAGLELKRHLKASGPVRFIAPTTGGVLSAAQLHHHRILDDGFELLIAQDGQELVVARTIRFQDIEAYAARDHGRPARSAKIGMLPPKLAQILINTTTAQTVVDPFCGTGVVLQEALLLGRSTIGSDVSAEMVASSQINLEWLASQYSLPLWQLNLSDAKKVVLPPDSAVVSEGYLGEPLTRLPKSDQLRRMEAEMSDFYRSVLSHWAGQIPAGGEVNLCLPSWRTAAGWYDLGVVDDLADLGYTLKQFARADGRVLRYARTDQLVGRRILLLTRS